MKNMELKTKMLKQNLFRTEYLITFGFIIQIKDREQITQTLLHSSYA